MLETNPKEQICPACGKSTKKIHDYRMQTIKDLPFQLKHCYLILHKRRYVCSCGKRFYEDYEFLPRYFHRTTRLTAFIASALHENRPLSSIAQMYNVSTATVNRILDTIFFDVPKIAYSARTAHPFRRNGAPFRFKLSKAQQVDYLLLVILRSLPGNSRRYALDVIRLKQASA